MLVSNQAELMYPALEGLGALGCGDSPCMPCMNKSMGIGGLGAPLSTMDSAWESWYCQGVASSIFPWCVPPTPADVIANDNSMFGGHLTQANRDVATSMAGEIVANDPSLQQDSNVNWWFIGGGIVLTLFLLK